MKKITKTNTTGKIKLEQEEVDGLAIQTGVKAGVSFRSSPVSFKAVSFRSSPVSFKA